jgi:hypothetical protein
MWLQPHAAAGRTQDITMISFNTGTKSLINGQLNKNLNNPWHSSSKKDPTVVKKQLHQGGIGTRTEKDEEHT